MIQDAVHSAVEHFDDITCEYTKGDVVRTRQLAKHVIYCRGGWALILFHAQHFAKGKWDPPHVLLSRWVRRRSRWRKHTTFSLRNGQAVEVLAVAAGWEASSGQLSALGIDLGASLQGAAEGLPSSG